ncbi:MAG: NUDIX hydrolase [Bacilli bacterium]|nr:NUDIX hydrolase [Bacilli bacterium]MDD4796052.1 NUDIX hydrolase [Bacilli bacterium]
MKRKIVLTGIFQFQDEFLAVQRTKNDDFMAGAWEFPGGNMEYEETILEALKRELLEETGIIINPEKVKIINFYDEIKEKTEKYHYVELDFLIELDSKDIEIKLSNEHDNYCWVKADSELLDDFIKAKFKNIN